jgi:hypothetical protein
MTEPPVTMKTKLILLFTAILTLGSLSSCVVPYGTGYGYNNYYRPSYYGGGLYSGLGYGGLYGGLGYGGIYNNYYPSYRYSGYRPTYGYNRPLGYSGYRPSYSSYRPGFGGYHGGYTHVGGYHGGGFHGHHH